jgi:hypothetical protein
MDFSPPIHGLFTTYWWTFHHLFMEFTPPIHGVYSTYSWSLLHLFMEFTPPIDENIACKVWYNNELQKLSTGGEL